MHKKFNLEKRQEYFKVLYDRYYEILLARNRSQQARQVSALSFEVLTGANSEFAAFARAFARAKKLDEYGVNIASGSDQAPQ